MMLNFVTPIVLFCSVIPGDSNICDGKTALLKHELDPVTTPMNCLLEGTVDATNYIVAFEKEHPNKKLQYRIVCKTAEKV